MLGMSQGVGLEICEANTTPLTEWKAPKDVAFKTKYTEWCFVLVVVKK